jgi:hypothetical protein
MLHEKDDIFVKFAESTKIREDLKMNFTKPELLGTFIDQAV